MQKALAVAALVLFFITAAKADTAADYSYFNDYGLAIEQQADETAAPVVPAGVTEWWKCFGGCITDFTPEGFTIPAGSLLWTDGAIWYLGMPMGDPPAADAIVSDPPASAPEPSATLLLAIGLAGVAIYGHSRRRRMIA